MARFHWLPLTTLCFLVGCGFTNEPDPGATTNDENVMNGGNGGALPAPGQDAGIAPGFDLGGEGGAAGEGGVAGELEMGAGGESGDTGADAAVPPEPTAAECGVLGLCTDAGAWCEPVAPEACHATPGEPVCYPPEHPNSVRYCQDDTRPNCQVLGECTDDGAWCEPEDEPACWHGDAPVCHEPGSPIAVMYCGEPEAVDCSTLGECMNFAWCEPERPDECHEDPGFPVCHMAGTPISVRYCGNLSLLIAQPWVNV